MIVSVIQIFDEKINSLREMFPVFCSGLEVEPGEGSLTSTSGSSLYSGSEFEEFLPTKGFLNVDSLKSVLL